MLPLRFLKNIMLLNIYPNNLEEFLIKWKNYLHTDNTWEPMDNLVGCEAAMKVFKVCLKSQHSL